LDKIMQMNGVNAADAPVLPASSSNDTSSNGSISTPPTIESTSRSRDNRQRDRDLR
jgi:hypothetical protein